MLICPITGIVNFDDMVKMVSIRFLQNGVTVFPFIIKKYAWIT